MILVTGGTGLVGSHLLYKLSGSGREIRAIYRSEHTIDSVKRVFNYYDDDAQGKFEKIEWVKATLNDIPALNEAYKDVKHVYHCAALVSFDPGDYKTLRKVNIKGTANMVNIALEHDIEKFCYVSSVAALGDPPAGHMIDEESPWNTEGDHHVYGITKYGAELEVWRAIEEGLKAVIVNPGVILGPGHWRSSSGTLFYRIQKGLKYYTRGTAGYVDIKDVIDPMIALMNSNIINERFILVSENLEFKDFVNRVAEELKVPGPRKEATESLLKIAWRLDWLRANLRGKKRRLTRHLARTLLDNREFDNSKIRQTLDYSFMPIEQSVKKTVDYYLKDRD